jgi:hypothetical protein
LHPPSVPAGGSAGRASDACDSARGTTPPGRDHAEALFPCPLRHSGRKDARVFDRGRPNIAVYLFTASSPGRARLGVR